MIKYTIKEFISKSDNLELWASKYTFKSWIVQGKPILDIRTNKKYFSGDLVFALIGYIDEDGKYHLVDDTKYFISL